MELLFRDSAVADIHTFVAHYEESFVGLYSDSGIWSERIILEGIRMNGKRLFRDIYDSVGSFLAQTPVIGRKKVSKGGYVVYIHVGSRLVVAHYSEDKRENTRWVESISIGRKPIIF